MAQHNHSEPADEAGKKLETQGADPADGKVARLSAEDIADAEAALAAPKAKPANDLTATGRDKTVVDTKTVVEDRTGEPARKSGVEVKATKRKLDNGTVLESYA